MPIQRTGCQVLSDLNFETSTFLEASFRDLLTVVVLLDYLYLNKCVELGLPCVIFNWFLIQKPVTILALPYNKKCLELAVSQ